MTEDEAKVTQCCGPEGCGYFNEEPRPARWCVGSACMAWRRQKLSEPRAKIEAIKDHRAAHNSTLIEAKNAVEAGWTDAPTEGYCGLAGST